MAKFFSLTAPILIGVLSAGVAAVAATAEALVLQEQNDISFISGGISDTEQQAIEDLGRAFNLKLTFATEDGQYLSAIDVRIVNAEGEVLVRTVSNGPLFYAELPPGDYTVQAAGPEGTLREKTAAIAQGKQTALIFRW